MIHAYPETSLSKAQSVLGDAFDYAINACGVSGEDFVKMFLADSVSKRIENGEPSVILGKSGIEVTYDIFDVARDVRIERLPYGNYSRTKEYWIGWAICYYQWYSGRSFSEIFDALPYSNLEKMYFTLHEADISKFVEIAESRTAELYTDTNLKRIRKAYGISQSELSKRSQVSLRSIQMYEQRNKDINKASGETLYNLAKSLGCDMEVLLEKGIKKNVKSEPRRATATV